MVGAGCRSLPPKLYLLFQFLQWWASQFFRVKPAKKTEKKKMSGIRKGPTTPQPTGCTIRPGNMQYLKLQEEAGWTGVGSPIIMGGGGVGNREQASDKFKLSWQGEDMQVGGKQA